MHAGIKSRPDLPTELLNEIFKWAVNIPGEPVLGNLCLSSRSLCDIAQPLLLQTVHIGTSTVVSQSKRIAQLDALANGNCFASQYACTLVIDYSGSFDDRTGVLTRLDKCMHKNLTRALESFKRVEKVIWYPRKSEHIWIHEAVAKALENVAPKELCIEWNDKFEPSDYHNDAMHRFRAFPKVVQGLVSQSTRLSRLDLNGANNSENVSDLINSLPTSVEHFGLIGSYDSTEIPEDALVILARLKNLKSLSLHTNLHLWSRYGNQHIWVPWNIFKREGRQLSHIYTDTRMDARFLSYLASYDHLQHLTLELRGFGPRGPPDGPPDLCHPVDLLKILSARHSQSLVKLGLQARYMRDAWAWPFDDEVKVLLGSLTKLKYLELSAYNSSENEIDTLLSFCENVFPSLIQLTLDGPWHERGRRIEEDNAHFFHAGVSYTSKERTSSARAIAAFKPKRVSGQPSFSIVSGTSTYTRRLNPDTGVYGYVNVD